MNNQTQGIQQLLLAEKKAAEKVITITWFTPPFFIFLILILSPFFDLILKVQEARKKKAQRLKQAKDEAKAEIEKFRSERERSFADYRQTHTGSM